MRHLMLTQIKHGMCKLVSTVAGFAQLLHDSHSRGFPDQFRKSGQERWEKESRTILSVPNSGRTHSVKLPLICRYTGHHQHHAPHSHDPRVVEDKDATDVQASLYQCRPQDCGSCCCMIMFLISCISELSILKHSALRPLSPRCKPPPCASLWVWAASLCWAACSRPRCTSSSSSPRRMWSLTDSISTGSVSVGPGPLIPSVSNKTATSLWGCGVVVSLGKDKMGFLPTTERPL